jgi:hypothetical protein
MSAIARYLDAWNYWVVAPILLIVAFFTFITWRKSSLLLVALGAAIYITSSLLQGFVVLPGQLGFSPALVTQCIGVVLSMTGLVWIWHKDRRQPIPARADAVRYRDVH